MKEAEMEEVMDCIADIIRRKENAIEDVKKRVAALLERFPIYPEME